MADSKVTSALEESVWGKKAIKESYASTGAFEGMFEFITDKEYEVPKANKPIIVRQNFKSRAGATEYVPFVAKITGEGVDGDNTLEGNEQELETYSFNLRIDQKRQAARIKGRMSEQKSSVKLFRMFKPQLVDWMKDYRNKEITRKLAGATTKTFSNTPTAATSNRVLYGGDATSTATIDATDTLDLTLISKANVLATNEYKTGTDGKYIPPVSPVSFGGSMKKFLCFVHPSQYFTLLESARVQQMLRDTGAYQKDNPLIQGGDICYNEVVIRSLEYLREDAVGQSDVWGAGANVSGATALFMGGCAAAIAESNDPRLTNEDFDYKNKKGTAIDCIFGVQKFKFNGQDLGVIALKTARDSSV